MLDIASGKAEMLCRIAAKYGSRCTGIERSTYFCQEAIDKVKDRELADLVIIRQMDGQDFMAADGSFDAVMCIGAEWIFGGLGATLANLTRWAKPGGTVVVGTPFWAAPPPDEYLQSRALSFEDFASHGDNVRLGEVLDLTLIYSAVSSQDDWDNYVGVSWRAAYDFIRDHPEDPDVTEIAELTAKDKTSYLQYGRDCLGWAIYVFRRS